MSRFTKAFMIYFIAFGLSSILSVVHPGIDPGTGAWVSIMVGVVAGMFSYALFKDTSR